MKDKIVKYCDHIAEFCLYFLIFCLPFTKAGVQVFAWTAILVWIIKKISTFEIPKKITLPVSKINKSLLIFLIVCMLSTFMSANFNLSLKALFSKVIKNIILIVVMSETINNRRRLRNIFLAITLSVCLIISDAGVQYFKGKDFLKGYTGYTSHTALGPRLQASFSSSNGFGGWLITLLPLLLMLQVKLLNVKSSVSKKIISIGLLGLCALLIICIGLTLSRAVWVSFIVSQIFIIYYILKLMNNRAKIIIGAVLIISVVTLYSISPKAISERLFSVLEMNNSILFRIELWKESLRIIEDFPLFGAGLNTYSRVGPNYTHIGGGGYPHNSYLQMSAEIGIIGFFSFLLIIFNLFKLGICVLKTTKDILILGLLAGILAFLVQSSFDVNLYALQLVTLFWFTLGLTVAKINILKKNENTIKC